MGLFPTRLSVVSLVLLVLMALPLSGAGAQATGNAGKVLNVADPDTVVRYEAPSAVTVCYVDLTGTTHYDPGDVIIMTFQGSCSGDSRSGDLRLSSWEGHPAGERLGSGRDRGQPLRSIDPVPRFFFDDRDQSNDLTPPDTVYLRITQSSQGFVRVGDVRITERDQSPTGSQVLVGDADVDVPLIVLGTPTERVRWADVLDTNGFDVHDLVYLTSDTTRERAGPGDVRLYNRGNSLAFGAILKADDPDALGAFEKIVRPLCEGEAVDGERVYYLSVRQDCREGIERGDVRLSSASSYDAGSRVAIGDVDVGGQYGAVPDARLAFLDEDGSGHLSKEDLVIVDVVAPAMHRLDEGDLLITPTDRGAGIVLKKDDPLIGTQLKDLGLFQDLTVFLSDGATGSIGLYDVPYLSTQALIGDRLRPGDVRLVPVGDHPFGGPVGLETGEVEPRLIRNTASVCSPRSIPGDYLPGDPVYLRLDGLCPTTVQAGMVRLVGTDADAAFTIVRASDTDVGRNLLSVSGAPQYKFVNVFTASGWNHQEAMYLDLVSPSTNRVDIGDIRVSSIGDLHGGSAVTAEDWDNGKSLTVLGAVDGRSQWIDLDGDGAFGPGDKAYAVPLFDQKHVGPLAVRLTPLDDPFVAPEVTEPSSSPSPTITPDRRPGPDRTPEQTLEDGPTDSPTGQPGPTGAPTPSIGTVVSLLALLGIVVLARRRYEV